MAKKQDKFSNMQMPPLWTGVAGQGKQKVYSLGGKWHPAGSTLAGGYQIVGDDGKGNLALSWNGLPVSVPMGGSTIQPYTPPSQPMFMGENRDTSIMGGGALSSDEERQLAAMGLQEPSAIYAQSYVKDPILNIDGMDESSQHKTYNVVDRTGIDEFIGKMKSQGSEDNFGTLDDYRNASPEQRRKGFRVWNNASGDFSDFFQDK